MVTELWNVYTNRDISDGLVYFVNKRHLSMQANALCVGLTIVLLNT